MGESIESSRVIRRISSESYPSKHISTGQLATRCRGNRQGLKINHSIDGKYNEHKD